jgi:beta-aspartyl-dipeptidase (metallo-type)
MLLIENANLYAPQPGGRCTILVSEGKITGIFPEEDGGRLKEALKTLAPQAIVVDAGGNMTIPGIIDRHVHFNGAGGEGGPVYRTPPLQLSAFIRAGVTSAVGMLGTDGTCRSLRELLMKARALEAEGITTWILTGNYRVPSPTITGGIMDDICLIDKVIGLKMAISDHRSSHPSVEEIRRAVSDTRTGGLLAGKAGTVCVHMGTESTSFAPLLRAIENSDILLTQFAPTHISRSEKLLKESIAFGRRGGNLDITATSDSMPSFGLPGRLAVKRLLAGGVAPERITLSSDGNGSMPRFNAEGRLVGMSVGPIDSILKCVLELLGDPEIVPEVALGMGTSHVADQLDLKSKGRLVEGHDADILILDGERKGLKHVVAKGRIMMWNGEIQVRGTFEL